MDKTPLKVASWYKNWKKANGIPAVGYREYATPIKFWLGLFNGLIFSLMFWALLTFPSCARAESSINNEQLYVKCVIGEAANQGFEGMVAVSEGIRNRLDRYGKLWGVDGCRAKHVDNQPSWVWWKAKQAWVASKVTNLTKGADHWHADWIPNPYWTKGAVQTAKIGQHKFYKGVR